MIALSVLLAAVLLSVTFMAVAFCVFMADEAYVKAVVIFVVMFACFGSMFAIVDEIDRLEQKELDQKAEQCVADGGITATEDGEYVACVLNPEALLEEPRKSIELGD